MYLKQLTISGFKSFAKKGELEFSAPITAIVGPNGSGKSNVAESFRFVLGEQSPSRMRGKRGEDLIWGGTDHIARANRASVTLTLNNEKRVFPVDFDEVIVERVVHRDGQNEYVVNGSRVRLKDIQELLAAANIGPSGHHIISQGEADRILLSNPKERREMIEDALGLKVYQFKKSEAERKLQKTRENIERVASLRREVAPHLKFLERQIKKIERAAAVKEELTAAYATYLKREDIYLAYHHDRLTEARREPAARLTELKDAHRAAKQKLQEAEKDVKRDALVAAEAELSEARATHQERVRALGQLEGQVAFLERRVQAATERMNRAKPETVAYASVAALADEIERAVEQAVRDDNVARLRRALTDIIHTFKAFLVKSEERGDPVTATEEQELSELREQKASLDTEISELTKKEAALQHTYDRIRTEIEAEASESREAEREMFRIVNEERECEGELARIDQELAALTRDREEFKRELTEAVALIGRAATEYQKTDIKENGLPVTNGTIVAEERTRQQNRRRELEKLKIRLEELGGANDDIEKEYREVKERDEFLVREVADLEVSVQKLTDMIAELTRELDTQFISGIEKINAEFNRFFALMFGGGEAKLLRVKPKVRKKSEEDLEEEEVEEETEEAEGIELDVKLPNKRVRGLEMLSGGERALTSIALIFAMSQVNPPLFVILDETDAALDEANSRRYGDMIEALAERSQLILITHNRETMRRAGVLYGVTMAGDGVSKLLSVKLEDAEAVAK
ncbi:MAG: AAA family ATPase [Candidatus Paceibacterota bacterium]